MKISLFSWLLIISIILLVTSRKWFLIMWKWIFRQLGFLLRLTFQFFKKVLEYLWTFLKGILKLVWMFLVKLFHGLFYLVPRLIYWFGLVIVEGFKFLFHALKSLVEILKP